MSQRHAPDSVDVVRDRDGLRYLRISFMTETRWVLDVMYQSGARCTYDLIEGDDMRKETVVRSVVPESSQRAHPSHAAAGAVAELAMAMFGSPVRLSLSRVSPVKGTVPLEGGLQEWDESVLADLVRRYATCQFEGMLEMLRTHYGLPAEGA